MREGIRHRGYALIDVLQPCVIFNRINTYDWYGRRVYKLEEAGHAGRDRAAAERAAGEWGDRIPIGVIYREEDVQTYEEQLPALRAGPLVGRSLTERSGLSDLMQRFM
jgi:2-oxoglutarate ferredoxin oxidoreductase subunit beta